MNLQEHYNKLYRNSISKIKADEYEVDPLIDSTEDNRRGITLLIRPDEKIIKKIQKFLDELKVIEPHQYYYPNTDLHITVMSIISCYSGFDISQVSIEEYIQIIRKSIKGISSFNIQFKGITASPSCVMIQGYVNDNSLNQIRENLRQNFRNSSLQQSIDKRYTIQTAHSTVVRLRTKLSNKTEYINLLDKYRDYDFGTFTIDTLKLVSNDWYQQKKHVTKVFSFDLSPFSI